MAIQSKYTVTNSNIINKLATVYISYLCKLFTNKLIFLINQMKGYIMTSKQRAYLKSLASTIQPIFQVGKSVVTPEFTTAIDEALEARELIKINVLKNCIDEPTNVAILISERTKSEVVQVIGRKIVLYRPSKNNPKIVLPKK